MKKILSLAFFGCALFLSPLANSAMISANGVDVNPLNLTGEYDTFAQFFDYRLSNTSSHTGYELKNEVMVFFANIGQETALIITAGGFGGWTGKVDATISGSMGGISFIDDPDGPFVDPFDGTTVNWAYARDKSDGLIYQGLFGDFWDIDLSLTKRGGGVNRYNVLTFDGDNNSSVALTEYMKPDERHSIMMNSVSAPAIVSLFVLAIGVLTMRAKRN